MRMTDAGQAACFLETLFPFLLGSRVRVRFGSGVTQFEADGKVAYAQPLIGMGITFGELTVEQRIEPIQIN